MPKYAAKVDDNQKLIVDAFKKSGVTVLITSTVGNGFTDLTIGYGGVTVLVEVKDGDKPPSARKLTESQERLHRDFKGAITVVENIHHVAEIVYKIKLAAALTRDISWRVRD